ncbi:hypothetical protein [Leeuwenhoekiella parthenopeia]|uniref:Major capsid protein n=1 Tax=Leeuwenhoekiella parthenopeia TaxID=2890320 RepID=A0ABS8GQZ0_9FLAO|nr:hypothetical protein [Leeuwenhoekiella parthenopeia]MCC4211702.1 hypothetical protein [Leeuwenhoekiella parthenopeia]
MSTLNKQIWTSQIMKHYYPEASFLNFARDFSPMAEYDIINMADAGFDPDVLINNTTYPIVIKERDDTPLSFELDLFETENTLVRHPDEVERSYDKMETVLYGHRMSLRKKTFMKAAHAYAPNADGILTPVIPTTGADNGEGTKRVTVENILLLKRKFDDLDVPYDMRYLVLDPHHTEDLILHDLKAFKDITDFVNGKPKRFAGFNMLEFTKNPLYNATTFQKKPFGSIAEETDTFSSFAFSSEEVMKADGTVKMYERQNDPELRATVVGFDKRFIALPIRNKAIGAIVGSKV